MIKVEQSAKNIFFKKKTHTGFKLTNRNYNKRVSILRDKTDVKITLFIFVIILVPFSKLLLVYAPEGERNLPIFLIHYVTPSPYSFYVLFFVLTYLLAF